MSILDHFFGSPIRTVSTTVAMSPSPSDIEISIVPPAVTVTEVTVAVTNVATAVQPVALVASAGPIFAPVAPTVVAPTVVAPAAIMETGIPTTPVGVRASILDPLVSATGDVQPGASEIGLALIEPAIFASPISGAATVLATKFLIATPTSTLETDRAAPPLPLVLSVESARPKNLVEHVSASAIDSIQTPAVAVAVVSVIAPKSGTKWKVISPTVVGKLGEVIFAGESMK